MIIAAQPKGHNGNKKSLGLKGIELKDRKINGECSDDMMSTTCARNTKSGAFSSARNQVSDRNGNKLTDDDQKESLKISAKYNANNNNKTILIAVEHSAYISGEGTGQIMHCIFAWSVTDSVSESHKSSYSKRRRKRAYLFLTLFLSEAPKNGHLSSSPTYHREA